MTGRGTIARGTIVGIAAFVIAVAAVAQDPPKPTPPPTQAELDQQELVAGLNEANQSAVDIIRFLEGFVKTHPQAGQRANIENVLARAAIEAKDDRRTILYGQRVLSTSPDDMLLLDRVARSLLILPGTEKERRENAALAFVYSTAFARKIAQALPPDGKEASHKQEDRDRALARAISYQARAKTVLGEYAEAEKLAAKAFTTYAGEESAREWSESLERLGRTAESIDRLADAFAIPDSHAIETDRAEDRKRLGERYRKLHGSEKGLGDLILAAYDRTAALVEERRAKLRAIDPNVTETEPMRFTLTGLDGKKLTLESLKGSVVILDFWATWCTPCRVQHPLYEEVKHRFKDRGNVVLLSIDTDDDRTLVAPFLDQMQWSKTSVYFEDGLQRLLNVTSIPTTILFDKEGRLASRMTGFLPDKFVDQLSGRIESALSEKQ
jgi:thiol-disulfide isomerase/thioredoxin